MRKEKKGFTLIEVLVAVVILSLLGGALLSLQHIIGKNQTMVLKNYRSIDEANRHVAVFIREVRGARSGENAAYALDTVNDNEIVFYSDIDFNGEVEKVRYAVDSSRLIKGVIKPIGYPAIYPADQEEIVILTYNVRNQDEPAFTYYNGDWPEDIQNNPLPPAQRLSGTRTVGIYIRINPHPDNPEGDYVLESYGQIRMLKENL